MRIQLLTLLLLASVAVPAGAQQGGNVERRVGKLESEMRAVQRKVFPGGNVEPEIRPQTQALPSGGIPSSSAVADLTARVDALEAQLATLTGQSEENTHRLRQLEEAMTRLRGETDRRLTQIERAEPAPLPAIETPKPRPPRPAPREDDAQPAGPATPGGGGAAAGADPGEEAYVLGFRLWEEGKYAEAQKALEAMAKKYPKHKRASYARNLAGRAYLDDGKPATAAKILLANYQTDAKGERAPDSLYFLGQALMSLKKPVEACKVYDELQDVYGDTMRDWVRQRLPKARADAKCAP